MSGNTINGTQGVFGNWFVSNSNFPSVNTSTNKTYYDPPVSWSMTNTTTAPINDTNYNYTDFLEDAHGIVDASNETTVQLKQVWFTLRIGLAVSFGACQDEVLFCER